MANLAEAVDATETDWIISADVSDAIDYFTVEDEIVKVTGNFPAQYQSGEGTTSVPRLRVERGAGGTTAVSHADATALTPLIPPSAASTGGAGVIVDNQSDPPAEVTTLKMGADVSVPGEATVTGLSAEDGPAGSQATVTVDVDGGEATTHVQASAGSGEAGSVFAYGSSDTGAALVENKATSTTGTADAHLDAESSAGIAESRLAVFGVPGAPLAGVTARHTPGGDLLIITGGDGIDGLSDPDYILTSDATVGSKWLPKPQAAAVADLALVVTDPPTQSEVQAIADKVDALLAALRASGQMDT